MSVSSPSDAAVLDLVAETLQAERNRLTPSTSFEELGLASFQAVELFTAVEDRFDVELDFIQFSAFVTLGQLIEAVSNASPGEGLAEAGEQR